MGPAIERARSDAISSVPLSLAFVLGPALLCPKPKTILFGGEIQLKTKKTGKTFQFLTVKMPNGSQPMLNDWQAAAINRPNQKQLAAKDHARFRPGGTGCSRFEASTFLRDSKLAPGGSLHTGRLTFTATVATDSEVPVGY